MLGLARGLTHVLNIETENRWQTHAAVVVQHGPGGIRDAAMWGASAAGLRLRIITDGRTPPAPRDRRTEARATAQPGCLMWARLGVLAAVHTF